jgi:aldose 1-epimerase
MINSNELLIDAEYFLTEYNGQIIALYTLENSNGMTVQLSNLGARIVSIIVPDASNQPRDVVVGMRTAKEYLNKEEPYYGAVIGPYTGRISNAQFEIEGTTHQLIQNNGVNTLHGGPEGLHLAVWETTLSENTVTFDYTFPDQKEGYPGPTHFKVSYTLTDQNELMIDYFGKAEKPTIINLTNHAYFNLNGEGSGKIENHLLQINSNQITTLAEDYSQTGERLSIINTPFDFNQLKPIGKSINDKHEQLIFGNGYDHYYIVEDNFDQNILHTAKLVGDQSGIVLDVFSTAQGVVLYTGNFMSDKISLKNGGTDSFRTAVCLETQDFPDSPNQPNFPSKIYVENNTYQSQTILKFSTTTKL